MTRRNVVARELWPEAMATVISCRYDIHAGRAMAFGLPTLKRFHITFNYWAGEELRTGEFDAEKPVPQGTLFPITYDPEAPQVFCVGGGEEESPTPRKAQLVIGVVGSIVLSLAWLLVLRGCR